MRRRNSRAPIFEVHRQTLEETQSPRHSQYHGINMDQINTLREGLDGNMLKPSNIFKAFPGGHHAKQYIRHQLEFVRDPPLRTPLNLFTL